MKVQAPGIERKFRADIRTCIAFCRLAMPQHVPPLEEIEKQFLTEFDYREEAKNLADVRAAVLPKWRHKVAIPLPYPELCTRSGQTQTKYARHAIFYCFISANVDRILRHPHGEH